ncbi:Phosphoethanolamine transferase EptA specific for the 1 phosphate group of core-lipid A [Salmonella enterica subsp. enterica]|nr:Phosphoethanolamine transferase EptA specific for the 1 phosphate group of core-lipid A [Salmonella enterica subsp. enterica] [Salmonella enterica subsp. enterica serovar Menston]
MLFHGLEDYIDHLKGDGVIVLHTIGSHGPTYYNRYPPQFKKFTPTCDTNEIQNCSQQQLINTYDNTVLYVDYIVDKAINLLKSHQDKFTTSLVYLSDHGESLGENGVYLHGLPYSIAPDTQNMSRCSFGFLKIINSVIRWIRPACKNGRARWIIHRTIFSQPCWD